MKLLSHFLFYFPTSPMCVLNPCLIFVSFCLIFLLLQYSKEMPPNRPPPSLITPPFSSTMAPASTLLYGVFPRSLTTIFKTNHTDFSYFLSSLRYLALLILYFFFSFWHFLKIWAFFFHSLGYELPFHFLGGQIKFLFLFLYTHSNI